MVAAVALKSPTARKTSSARRTDDAAKGYVGPDAVRADTYDLARRSTGMRDALVREVDPRGETDGRRLAAVRGQAGNAENGS